MSWRILIVDDDGDSAESLSILFQLEGHEVQSLTQAEKVLDAASSFRPDLIVLDIGLPRTDGYAIARGLRENGCSARLVALTGYGRAEDVERAYQAGFDHHCLKPVEPRDLLLLMTSSAPVFTGNCTSKDSSA